MKVLLTNISMSGRSGSVIITRDLALALRSQGHQPLIYTSVMGPEGDALRTQGIPVVTDISRIADTPDIIHGHHSVETATAALFFPRTPTIFVCHDFVAWHDEAPQLPNIVHYVAISEGFRRRLTTQDGIPPERTSVVLNGVDTDRFKLGPPLGQSPRKALVFAKSARHFDVVREACALRGLKLDAVGAVVGKVTSAPEFLLDDYDLVFTSAVSAMECISSGRAVIVCDGRGVAGFADMALYSAWRSENFGVPVFYKHLSVEAVVAEIDRYDADQARQVTQRLRQDAALPAWAAAYLYIYRNSIASFEVPDLTSVGKAAASLFQRWSPVRYPPASNAEPVASIPESGAPADWLAVTDLGREIHATAAKYIELTGFYDLEPWGSWGVPPESKIRMRPSGPFSRLSLTFKIFSTPSQAERKFDVLIDEKIVGRIAIKLDDIKSKNVVTLSFETISKDEVVISVCGDNGASPSDSGSTDGRKLGFGFISLLIE